MANGDALNVIANLLGEHGPSPALFKRNLIKEFLQVLALSFIYTHDEYSRLIFYGGSCLRHCHNLPRMSEDIDLVDMTKNVSIEKFARELGDFFKKEIGIEPTAKDQKFRVYLKFPILKKLKLAGDSESDLLFLKVEVFKKFDCCKNFKTEIKPIFKYNKSILINTFDLPTLMSTKIRAVLQRKWERTSKSGQTIATVKGRDYFDLMWFLEKGIKPNPDCLKEYGDLKGSLLDIISKVDASSIIIDLENLIEDQKFVAALGTNILSILKNQIETKL